MSKNILKLQEMKKLSKEAQKSILGGVPVCPVGMHWYTPPFGGPSACVPNNIIFKKDWYHYS